MTHIIINGQSFSDKSQLHAFFKSSLSFPEWYGANLDALFDCLTDIHEETLIEFYDFGALKENLKSYADAVMKVLKNAQAQNPNIHITE